MRRDWEARTRRDDTVKQISGEWRQGQAKDARRAIDDAVIPPVLLAEGWESLGALISWFLACTPQTRGPLPAAIRRILTQMSGPNALRGGAWRTTAFRVQAYLRRLQEQSLVERAEWK